jgi:hypothetical protein
MEREKFVSNRLLLKDLKEQKMSIYGMWPWKVPKWLWFWAEVAVKAWRDLATLFLRD